MNFAEPCPSTRYVHGKLLGCALMILLASCRAGADVDPIDSMSCAPAMSSCDDADPCTIGDSCVLGVCAGTALLCDTPPPATCVSATTLRTFTTAGICTAGDCSYDHTDTTCAASDCADGVCGEQWNVITTTGAPTARDGHTVVWTGSEMIVWGGYAPTGQIIGGTGGRYNPATKTWAPTSLINAPSGRTGHTAIWTGTEMIVWGGFGEVGPNNNFSDGARYNPTNDTWTPLSTTGAPSARFDHTAIWTGSEMIVWGGEYYDYPTVNQLSTGGRYNLATNSWTATQTTGSPVGRKLHTAVWTGSKMIVWGGTYYDSPVDAYLKTGGRYNPATNEWTATPTVGAPAGRDLHTAVWTGSEMIVWGGYSGYAGQPDHFVTGGRYNPDTNSWTATSVPSEALGSKWHTAVWTGSEMIVWGGDYTTTLHAGGRYQSDTDSWAAITNLGDPTIRSYHTAVWTGSEMIVWGGRLGSTSTSLNTGESYTP